ncbi:MAG: hypothetical protein ACIARR_01850 [Phycisphaerales bacterium JB059]
MNHIALKQARLMGVLAAVAPVVAVGLIRFAGPQPVAAASWADTSMDLPAFTPLATPKASNRSGVMAAAAAHAQRLFQAGIQATPFPLEKRETIEWDTPEPIDAPDERASAHAPEPPPLHLSAIMSRRAGAIAVIDARIRTAGSKIGQGWTLESIDEEGRTITVRHTTGHRATLELEAP